MKKYLPLLLGFVLVLSACKSQSLQLTGQWKLIAYGSLQSMTTPTDDSEAGLTFGDDGTVTGNSGCNSLGGEYKVEDKKITFSEVTSTLMACDEALMNQESVFTQVMNGTAEFEIEDQTLAITNKDMVLVFTAVPAK